MKQPPSYVELLRDWPAILNDIFREDLGEGDFFVASDPLDRRLATLGRIVANPKTRHAAMFVVSCPQGDPMLRVYLIEGEPMFVPARTSQFGIIIPEVPVHDHSRRLSFQNAAEGEHGVDWAADQIRRLVAQTEDTVQAQCQHRYCRIPRQWLLDRLEEGRHGAVFAD
jgi:hypothetical protein